MLRAPKGTTDQLASGGDFTFPPGKYVFELEETRARGVPTNMNGEPFAGFVSTEPSEDFEDGNDGLVLGLQFAVESLSEEIDVGERKWFEDIVLRDGELTLDDVDVSARDFAAWQLQRSARTLMNMFRATGHVVDDGNGEEYLPDEVIAELEAGGLAGLRVGAEVINRQESAKKYRARLKDDPGADRRVYDSVKTFFVAS